VLQIPTSGGATMIAGKPQIASPDGRFSATLHGVMQFDAAEYSQKTAGPINVDLRRGAAAGDTARARDLSSGSNFRRARIGVDGKMFGDFEYNLLFEYGGAGTEDAGHIQELWVQYSGLKPFHFRIGAFPPSIGLADQASTNGAPFLERPAIADIARSLAGGDFREAAEVWAAGDRWYVNGAVTGRVVGVVNSQATGVSQPFDNQLGLIGRLAFLPLKGDGYMAHLGVHGSYIVRPGDAGGPDVAATTARYPVTFQERPELRVDGTRLISTGALDANHASTLGFEAAAQYRNLYIEGEYERLSIERRNVPGTVSDPDFSGFYVQGSWLLTGEARRYNPNTFAFDAPTVDHPFSLQDGSWGALELALRYSKADLNYHDGALGTAPSAEAVRGGDQRIWAAGVNWYVNAVTRFMLQYQDVKVDRLSPSATTFQTPVGAQVGQNYHTIALRSQLAF
jgi:phosphate-selective porin OprO and OprP